MVAEVKRRSLDPAGVLDEEAVAEVHKSGIRFVALSYESGAPRLAAAEPGETV